jgi:methionine synthase II (cobalamin-independent)
MISCVRKRARSVMSFNPQGLATAIGSLPHQNPKEACRVILNSIPEIPIWPQLPAADFREGMEIQYSEGLPGMVLDPVGRRMHFETAGDITSALEKFYENYMAENLDYFRISPDFSRGIYEMERMLAAQKPPGLRYFKNQVTGPITVGLGRTDENKRAIYYNEMMRDVVIKGTEMKARWVLSRFRALNVPQLCFIDEPILSAFGSSTYVSLQRSDVVQHLRDVIAAVHKEGGLAGIHCCGNTEWTILIDAGTDIISFDAYGYGETIAYYPEPVKSYLERGGVLAWGIVPTSAKIEGETADSLLERLRSAFDNLAGKGISKGLIAEKCLITPSCGTGSLPIGFAEKVFSLLGEVSRKFRA